ncbi:MAG: sugar ABC transporter ATP-binding protein [Dehalococcoidia bacterium]|nr:sugar ABC transporter ATP-binding protein [Dehalococcoidia bacterium]
MDTSIGKNDSLPAIALEMIGINKSFASSKVLNDISFQVHKGEVHALAGENGAGKSVLMKTLMGVYQPDSGTYLIDGRVVRFSSPAAAQRQHVSMVYQEFGLVPFLTVTENILMGRMPRKNGFIDWKSANKKAEQLLNALGVSSISPKATVSSLRVAEQQDVEIARALSYDPSVFIMDEASAALSLEEVEHLHELVKRLSNQGVSIVYITHHLEEIWQICDRVTILRDGSVVSTNRVKDISVATLINRMTGKKISGELERRGRTDAKEGQSIFQLKNFEAKGLFSDINLTVSKKEVVGVAGLTGAGKTELGKAIFGALPKQVHLVSGEYIFNGRKVKAQFLSPAKARKMGIGFVSEDRKAEGLINAQSVHFNITLPALSRISRWSVIIRKVAEGMVSLIIKQMALRPPDPNKQVEFLSGGNQQKVVVGKWLASEVKLLILDEPTRGVDIGAREELYKVLQKQKEQGGGVLLLSSDLREVISNSDRILVMRQGKITTEVPPYRVSEEKLLKLVLGEEAA